MPTFPWQLIKQLRAQLLERDDELRRVWAELDLARRFVRDAGDWGRMCKAECQRVHLKLAELCNSTHCLAQGQERIVRTIMATLQDMKDELAAQNQALLDLGEAQRAEIEEINEALAALGQSPTPEELDEIVAGMRTNTENIKASTEAMKGIINTPLPEPEPEPLPEPEPEPTP